MPLSYLAVITLGTVLLMLPMATTAPGSADPLTAMFTAVSAACITGMTIVDTATYWTPFGQGVIMFLVQIGGLGIMSLATLLALIVFGKMGLRTSMLAQNEAHGLARGEIRGVLFMIVSSALVLESFIAIVLTGHFMITYDHSFWRALWHGCFHGVSAFNNSGFTLFSDNLVPFVGDAWMIVPICIGIVAGGIGFPVYYELLRRARAKRSRMVSRGLLGFQVRTDHERPPPLSVHAKVTLLGYFGLTVISTAWFGFGEWNNPGTLGPLDTSSKVLGVLLGGISPRTAGFNSVDYSQATQETLFLDGIMMFIGGGSAGTAGGIKVGTFVLLAFVIWAELRGNVQVTIGSRGISNDAIRQALSVALLGVAAVVGGTLALLAVSDFELGPVLFEATSAFGTAGLSTGITGEFSTAGKLIVMFLMLLGRLGPIAIATALALNTRKRAYTLPEQRPIIG